MADMSNIYPFARFNSRTHNWIITVSSPVSNLWLVYVIKNFSIKGLTENVDINACPSFFFPIVHIGEISLFCVLARKRFFLIDTRKSPACTVIASIVPSANYSVEIVVFMMLTRTSGQLFRNRRFRYFQKCIPHRRGFSGPWGHRH